MLHLIMLNDASVKHWKVNTNSMVLSSGIVGL